MNPFTQHPAAAGESYWQHMGVALWFAGRFFVAALAALVHALFPFLCTRTGSTILRELHQRVESRR